MVASSQSNNISMRRMGYFVWEEGLSEPKTSFDAHLPLAGP